MSEFLRSTPEHLRNEIRAEQNKIEEHLEHQFLSETLFHIDHHEYLSSISLTHAEYLEGLGRMQLEFLEEKRGKNMGERFAMAISDKYLGKIDVVELGSTTNPGASGEVDGLKGEYTDLLHWMVMNNVVEGEVPREKSKRFVEWRRSEVAPDYLIISRNRPLIESETNLTIPETGKKINFGIAKRMTFALPSATMHGLYAIGGSGKNSLNDEKALKQLEVILDHASGGIVPIRTSYYLSTQLV